MALTEPVLLQASRSDLPIDAPVVPLRHYGRWAFAVMVAIIAAMIVQLLITNPNFQWDVVFAWFFAHSILQGLWVTLGLTTVAMVGGIVIGIVLALMKQSENVIVSAVAGAYIWVFRGTPLLVQLIFWYNIAALIPIISIGIPFGPSFVSWDTNVVVTPLAAAIVGLSLHEGAYMAEIVRSGLLSVPKGQIEAANALGMSRTRIQTRIVLPQALRIIIPPTGNQLISMLKNTSLVSVIAMSDLLYSTQTVYNRTFETIPLLITASLWYLVITTILSTGQYFLERHYGRGSGNNAQPLLVLLWQRIRGVSRATPSKGAAS